MDGPDARRLRNPLARAGHPRVRPIKRMNALKMEGRHCLLGLIGIQLLSGCATSIASHAGRTKRDVDATVRVVRTRDSILLQLRGTERVVGPLDGPSKQTTFWTKLDQRKLFSASPQSLDMAELRRGVIPKKYAEGGEEISPWRDGKCFSFSALSKGIVLRDSCDGSTKEMVLEYPAAKHYRSTWAYPLLPILIPLGIAADIVMSPYYGYCLVNLGQKGCPK